jgi:outer membrane immunogenic protein
MRRLAMMAAAAAFFGGGAVASAADLGSYKDSPSYAPAPIWTGYYIGGHAGGLWSDDGSDLAKYRKCKIKKHTPPPALLSSAMVAPPPGPQCDDFQKSNYVKFEDDDEDVTFIGGVHLGYNWQVNSTVLGIEGDVSFADNIDYLASLRGRLGWARDNFLIYATAGVAFAGMDNSSSFKYLGKSYSYGDDEDRQIGFVVGGGAEYKIRPNLSVGLEGLYYAFGDDSSEHGFSTGKHNCYNGYKKCWKEYKLSSEDDDDLWTIRARLTYHFGEDHDAAPLK